MKYFAMLGLHAIRAILIPLRSLAKCQIRCALASRSFKIQLPFLSYLQLPLSTQTQKKLLLASSLGIGGVCLLSTNEMKIVSFPLNMGKLHFLNTFRNLGAPKNREPWANVYLANGLRLLCKDQQTILVFCKNEFLLQDCLQILSRPIFTKAERTKQHV